MARIFPFWTRHASQCDHSKNKPRNQSSDVYTSHVLNTSLPQVEGQISWISLFNEELARLLQDLFEFRFMTFPTE